MIAGGAQLDPSVGASSREGPPERSAWRQLFYHLDLVAMAGLLAVVFQILMTMRVGTVGLYNDDVSYAIGARELALYGRYDLPVLADSVVKQRFPIGFPWLLSLFWKVGGQNVGVVGLWEVVVICLAVGFLMLAYAMLTRVWKVGRTVSALAIVLVAFHPLLMKYGSCVMSDLPFAFFGLASLATIEGLRRPILGGSAWRSGLGTLGAAVLMAWAILLRYAGLTALVAGALTLWLDGKRKQAVVLMALTGGALAPWVWWALSHNATGYVVEVRRDTHHVPVLAVVGRGLHWLAAQALPGLVAPLPFLGGLAGVGVFKPTWAPLDFVGIAIALGLLTAAAAAVAPRTTRLPALYALLTVALVGAWSGAFPKLGWDLEVRLLLPAAPLLLAFLFQAIADQALALSAARRAAILVACSGILLWVVHVDRLGDMWRNNYSQAMAHATAGLPAAGAYLAHIPASVQIGATYPLQAFFYAPRPFWQVFVTPAGLKAARAHGIKLVFAQPFYFGGEDYTRESIEKLVHQHLAQVLFVASDHIAVVRLLSPPKSHGT